MIENLKELVIDIAVVATGGLGLGHGIGDGFGLTLRRVRGGNHRMNLIPHSIR
jgi:hypothetical protein